MIDPFIPTQCVAGARDVGGGGGVRRRGRLTQSVERYKFSLTACPAHSPHMTLLEWGSLKY